MSAQETSGSADLSDTGPDGVMRCPVRHDFQPYSSEGVNNPLDHMKPHRKQNPVFFCPQVHMWMVTRDEDVRAAPRDMQRISSNAFRQPDALPDIVHQLSPEGVPPLPPSLINPAPPAHKRTRKLANL